MINNKVTIGKTSVAVIEADCDCCNILPERKRRKLQAAYEAEAEKSDCKNNLIKLLPEIARALEVVSDEETCDSDDDNCVHEHDCKPRDAKEITKPAVARVVESLSAPARLPAPPTLLPLLTSSNVRPLTKPLGLPPRLFLKKDESRFRLKEINSTLLQL